MHSLWQLLHSRAFTSLSFGRFFAVALMLFLLPTPAFSEQAGEKDKQNEYLISAETLQNNEKAGTIEASGQVEVQSEERRILAEHILLDQRNDTVLAQGHVAVVEKDGTVLFAHESEMANDMRDGKASTVAMLLPDNSRMVAADARRSDGRFTQFSKGLYSPCNLCADNPRKAPLWQLKAVRTTHDSEKKDLIYRDATLEMMGIPVFYTPYFSHPDPTVKRRQGFLTPGYGHNTSLQNFVTIPYYFDIAPDLDYTFSPTFSGEDKMRWGGLLRKRFEQGSVSIDHSLVIADRLDDDGITKKDQIRGHVFGTARFDIDNVFRTGAHVALLTDKNYMQRYSQSADDVLENRVYVEGFKGRQTATAEFFYFQDNRPAPKPEQPLVMPRLHFKAFGEPDMTLGGRWSINGMMTILQRDVGADTKKASADFGWERRDILPLGLVSDLKAHIRDDFFYVDKLADFTTPGKTFDGDATNRLSPQGQIMLSYPLANDYGAFSHIVEPLVALTSSPTIALNPRIPNEDSIDVEYDTTNLFELSRYPGTDQIEQGTRLSYGLKNSFYATDSAYAEFVFGQNYRLTPDPLFPAGSGLETTMSDYVGQVKMVPGDWANLDYFFRLDKDGLKFRKHDVVASFGIPQFRPRFSYTNIDPPVIIPGSSGRTEELKYGFTSQINQYWSFSADQTRDLRPATEGPLKTSIFLGYADECFSTSLTFTRDHTVRTGVKSGDSVLFRIYFKNLGGIDGGQ